MVAYTLDDIDTEEDYDHDSKPINIPVTVVDGSVVQGESDTGAGVSCITRKLAVSLEEQVGVKYIP